MPPSGSVAQFRKFAVICQLESLKTQKKIKLTNEIFIDWTNQYTGCPWFLVNTFYQLKASLTNSGIIFITLFSKSQHYKNRMGWIFFFFWRLLIKTTTYGEGEPTFTRLPAYIYTLIEPLSLYKCCIDLCK